MNPSGPSCKQVQTCLSAEDRARFGLDGTQGERMGSSGHHNSMMNVVKKLGVVALQNSIAQSGPNGEMVEVLFVWSVEKFEARLRMMRDAYDHWSEDPSNFSLGYGLMDPWSELGPVEVDLWESRHRAALEDREKELPLVLHEGAAGVEYLALAGELGVLGIFLAGNGS